MAMICTVRSCPLQFVPGDVGDPDTMASSITASKKVLSSFETPKDNSLFPEENRSCSWRPLLGSDRMRDFKRRDDCI